MSWTELPPDFYTLPISQLSLRMSALDVINLLHLSISNETVFLIDRSAAISAREFVAKFQHETGGLLIGTVYNFNVNWRSNRKVALITNSVPAEDYVGSATALRMETKLWQKAKALQKENEFVIGWFHSHPNLGAFFSGTDRRTQSAFFSMPHSLGWVIDPFRREEAWFSGPTSQKVSESALWEVDSRSHMKSH